MRFLVWGLMLTVGLWANNVKVDYDTVTVVIDEGNETSYEKDETFHLDYDKKICLVKGDGMVIITKESGEEDVLHLLGESKKCTTLRKVSIKEKSLWEKFKGLLGFVGKKSTDTGTNGVGKKEIPEEDK